MYVSATICLTIKHSRGYRSLKWYILVRKCASISKVMTLLYPLKSLTGTRYAFIVAVHFLGLSKRLKIATSFLEIEGKCTWKNILCFEIDIKYHYSIDISSMALLATAVPDTRSIIQWNLSVTTTSIIKSITCDLFSNVFNGDWRYQFTLANTLCLLREVTH